MKKTTKNGIILAFALIGFATVTENVSHEVQNKIEYHSQINNENVVPFETVDQKDINHDFTENDIYNMNESYNDKIIHLPLKAMRVKNGNNEYTVLHDGQGSFYVTLDLLENGKNYIGTIENDYDEIILLEKSDFSFTYEEDFIKYYELDYEYSLEFINETYNNM